MSDVNKKINDSDVLTSVRRTLVPLAVGFVLAQAARWGFDIPADQLAGVIEAVVTGVYYTVVRVLEVRFPQVSFLLGASLQPRYEVPENASAS